jgi:hypothetical protein
MTDSYIQTIPDSTGKKCRTLQETVNSQTVETQVVAVEDGAGAVIKPALEDGGNLEVIAEGITALSDSCPNPLQVLKSSVNTSYNDTVTQWTYTVPANRRAKIEYMQATIIPMSSYVQNGHYEIIQILLNGEDEILYLRKNFVSATPNYEPVSITGNGAVTLLAGDVLTGVQESNNTAGMRYSVIAKILEFDA